LSTFPDGPDTPTTDDSVKADQDRGSAMWRSCYVVLPNSSAYRNGFLAFT